MRFINLLSLTLLSATPLLSSVSAQADGAPVDPNATCDQATLDSITTCLGQVYTDESARDGGPCTSSDSAENWACICNVQLGLTQGGCWAPCPGLAPKEDQDYFDQNCNGQHSGVTPSSYTGSPITTTVPSGASGTAGTVGASSVPSTTAASPTTSDSSASSSVSNTSSAVPSSTTANQTGTPAGNDNGAIKGTAPLLTLVAGLGLGALLL